MQWLWVVITVLVGYVSSKLAEYLKFPAPYLIGSLLGVAIFNIISQHAFMPFWVKPLAQMVAGTYIGMGIRRENLLAMRMIIKPILYALISVVFIMLFSSGVLYFVFDFDLPTALLSSVPGGISDITLLSYEFNADIAVVALIQTMRLCIVLAVFPLLIERIFSPQENVKTALVQPLKEVYEWNYVLITILIGGFGGAVGYLLKIPAGSLSLSMIFTAIYSCISSKAQLPVSLRRAAQLLSGALIGTSITITSMMGIPAMFPAMLFVMVLYFASNYFIARFISKRSELNHATAMFATAPAGASDMVLIALELNLEVDKSSIILIQIARLTLVVTLIPGLIQLILSIFG